jgi:hypothetical protein
MHTKIGGIGMSRAGQCRFCSFVRINTFLSHGFPANS